MLEWNPISCDCNQWLSQTKVRIQRVGKWLQKTYTG